MDRDAGEARQRADRDRVGDAAADRDVRLDQVERAPVDRDAGVASVLERFAAGQRQRQALAQSLVVDVAVGRERLLEPAEAEVVERLADPDRIAERVGGVAIGHEIERASGNAARSWRAASSSAAIGSRPMRSLKPR